MIIERKEYLNKLITWKDKQLIKIVTGVRRCGKSVLLKMYQDYYRLFYQFFQVHYFISIFRELCGILPHNSRNY